jgi:hypothetical protein
MSLSRGELSTSPTARPKIRGVPLRVSARFARRWTDTTRGRATAERARVTDSHGVPGASINSGSCHLPVYFTGCRLRGPLATALSDVRRMIPASVRSGRILARARTGGIMFAWRDYRVGR